MSGINRVIITGNLTRDPEVRHTREKVPLCDMRLAVSTRVREDKDVCYIDVIAWERQAESCGAHLKKGSWVLVEGRLKLNEWETRQGDKRSRIIIVAHRVVFLNVHDRPEPMDKGDCEDEG